MALYLISYDLVKPEKDYPKLIDFLEKAGAKKVLLSDWMLKTADSREAVFNAAKAHIDGNDRLMVSALDSAIGTGNLLHSLKDF